MVTRVFLFLLICGSASLISIYGQDKPTADDGEVIRIETELIEVPVHVFDATGKPVAGLRRSDFRVFEDGRVQEIASFSTTTAPLEIALLLDTSGSTRSELNLMKNAARQFTASLREGDRVGIVSYNTGIVGDRKAAISEVLIGLTNDRRRLGSALERVSTSNGTPYYDSLIQVFREIFIEKPSEPFTGRRAIVALTDGVDSTSDADFDEVAELAQESGVAIYFVRLDTRPAFEADLLGDCQIAMRFSIQQIRRYYAGFGARSNVEQTTDFCQLGDFERLAISRKLYEIADDEMARLSARSGGRIFDAANLSEARTAFKKVADDLGTIYSIGYYSDNERKDGKFRSIKVDVAGLPAGSTIRNRQGYTARRGQ